MADTENKKLPLYERRWARIFTYIVYILIAVVTYLLITDEAAVSWHQAVRFYIFGTGWLAAYDSSRPQKRG